MTRPSSVPSIVAVLAWAASAFCARGQISSGPFPLPVLPPAPAGIQVTTEYGIEFSTVNAGSTAWTGTSYDPFLGGVPSFGSVGASYRIARTELTSGQFFDFFNALSRHQEQIPALRGVQTDIQGGSIFGYQPDLSYIGPGRQWLPPSAEQRNMPVDGVSWYTAAMFANYLHNGQANSLASLLTGSYDLQSAGDGLPEQRVRSAGARFWIPSADEWYRATYFNPLTATWQETPLSSGAAVPYGPPGQDGNLANAGGSIFAVPVGQYSLQSPWGLLDTAGNVTEWGEFSWPYQFPDQPVSGRMAFGSNSGDSAETAGAFIDRMGGYRFSPLFGAGIRMAAVVPAPGTLFGVLPVGSLCLARARR